MKKILTLLLLILLMVAGCAEDRAVNPTVPSIVDGATLAGVDVELVAGELILASNWEFDEQTELPAKLDLLQDKCFRTRIVSFKREMLADGIAHYSYDIAVGHGPYNVFGLHRVVKERRPYRPARTRENLFMVHGDGAAFEAAFLLPALSDAVPAEHACPIYLAKNGVDVWGIDFPWTKVPVETQDFSFMSEWGTDKEIGDLEIGLAVARIVRLFTGCGFDKLNLLGWSRGASTSYAYLNEESQKPYRRRHVGAFIPTEMWIRPPDPTYVESECLAAADYQAGWDAGTYMDDTGALLQYMAAMANEFPDDPSDVIEDLTHLQAALFFGSLTYEFGLAPENYHTVGGTFDEEGLPDGLLFMPNQRWLDFIANWAPYQNIRLIAESQWTICNDASDDVPWDDHLADITVPVLYIGANGGFGDTGIYTTTFLGSTDVSSHIVTVNGDPYTDFAHADLFLGDGAETLVWEPLLDWLQNH